MHSMPSAGDYNNHNIGDALNTLNLMRLNGEKMVCVY